MFLEKIDQKNLLISSQTSIRIFQEGVSKMLQISKKSRVVK